MSQFMRPTGHAATSLQSVQELLRRHNNGELDLPDEQVRQLSNTAAALGMKFEAESKPVRKFLFDGADTALFGLLPNEWRPYSIGQETHGESWIDRQAGNLGTIGGGLATGGLLLKGGKKALGGIKGWFSKGTQATAAQRAYANSQPGGLLNMPSVQRGMTRTQSLGLETMTFDPNYQPSLPPRNLMLNRYYSPFGSGLNQGTTSVPIMQTYL